MKAVLFSGILAVASVHAQTGGAFLDQYCAYCHNDQLKTGNMSLSKLDAEHPERNAELAEKVIRKVRTGLMPPPGGGVRRRSDTIGAPAGTTRERRRGVRGHRRGAAVLHRRGRG